MANNIPVIGGGDGPTDLVLEYHVQLTQFIGRYHSDYYTGPYPDGWFYTDPETSQTYDANFTWDEILEIEEGSDPPVEKEIYEGTIPVKLQDYGGVTWWNEDGSLLYSYGHPESNRYQGNFLNEPDQDARLVFGYGKEAFNMKEYNEAVKGFSIWKYKDAITDEETSWVLIVTNEEGGIFNLYAAPFKGVGVVSSVYDGNWISISVPTVVGTARSNLLFNRAGNKAVGFVYENDPEGTSHARELIIGIDEQVEPRQPKVISFNIIRTFSGVVTSSTYPDGGLLVTQKGEAPLAVDYQYDADALEGVDKDTIVYAVYKTDVEWGASSTYSSSNPCTYTCGEDICEGDHTDLVDSRESYTTVRVPTGIYVDNIARIIGPIETSSSASGTSNGTRQFTGNCVYDDTETVWETSASGSSNEGYIWIDFLDLRFGHAGWSEKQKIEETSNSSSVGAPFTPLIVTDNIINFIAFSGVTEQIVIPLTPNPWYSKVTESAGLAERSWTQNETVQEPKQGWNFWRNSNYGESMPSGALLYSCKYYRYPPAEEPLLDNTDVYYNRKLVDPEGIKIDPYDPTIVTFPPSDPYPPFPDPEWGTLRSISVI